VLRSIAAVMAGFGFMVATSTVGRILATALFVPGGLAGASAATPASFPVSYLAAELLMKAFGSIVAGWLAARIAAVKPFAHAIALATVVAAVSIVTAVAANVENALPRWYGPLIDVIYVGGVLLGGSLRAAAAQAPAPSVS
jgi:hypothetical protein